MPARAGRREGNGVCSNVRGASCAVALRVHGRAPRALLSLSGTDLTMAGEEDGAVTKADAGVGEGAGSEEKKGGNAEGELTEEEMRERVIRLAFGGDRARFHEFCDIVREAIPPETS